MVSARDAIAERDRIGALIVQGRFSRRDWGFLLNSSRSGLRLVVGSLFGTCVRVALSLQKPFPAEHKGLQLSLDFRGFLANVF
jgi:hypothetical protein